MSFFIVFEGLDGSGAGTQSEILREKLMANQHIIFLRYPSYNNPIGELIYKCLKEKVPLQMESLFMLFALDQTKDNEKIKSALGSGKIVLADRYFTSNIAYQCAKGFDLNRALKIGELLQLPQPDLVILLKVSPETSVQRKIKEKRNLDMNEENLQFQKKVQEVYEKLMTEKIFAKEWVVVDSEKSIDEVARDVEKIVTEKLNS
jgi:dTMP kinase